MSGPGRRQRGVTKFEFAVVAALFAIFIGTFLNALHTRQEQAEKLLVELTVMNMRTALLGEIADRLIKGRGADTSGLLGANPVRFLKGPPAGYVGEFKTPDASQMQPGSWCFDASSGELIYYLSRTANFKRLDGVDLKEIRWRIAPRDKNGHVNSGVDALSLNSTVDFQWF